MAARHLLRPHRLFVPQTPLSATSARLDLPFASSYYPPSTPTATSSNQHASSWISRNLSNNRSFPFLLSLLFSLRSVYTLFPFIRSSPSFSLLPFAFLVSLFSFLLTLAFSIFSSSSPRDHFQPHKKNQRIFSLSLITQSQRKLLLAKSALLAAVILLRFQALRYCGVAAMILAELSGNAAANFVKTRARVRGFVTLLSGLLLLSVGWDRIECFPFSASNVRSWTIYLFPLENCSKIWPMLMSFVSGFLVCYERKSTYWPNIRQLGSKRIRLISVFYTTILLLVPALVSFFMYDTLGNSISFDNLAWPLANTVVFGVVLSENYDEETLHPFSNNGHMEFLLTFMFTLPLELFYSPEISLCGLLLCGFLLWVAIRQLNPVSSDKIGSAFDSSSRVDAVILKPIYHILSERKSRKIALFLALNAAYMVVEFVTGLVSNSLGLISDACHMLFDCAALGIGLYASYISRLPANYRFSYGRGRFEVLSGYVNAVFLVLVGALIVLESIERILEPQEISTDSLLTVSIGGLLVNIVGLVFFHEEHHHAHGGGKVCSHSHSLSQSQHVSGKNACVHEVGDVDHHRHVHHYHQDLDHAHCHQHHDHADHHHVAHDDHCEGVNFQHKHIDHNMEGIFLHVLADTMGSVGVVISTLLIKYRGWLVADPASSIFISALIISSVIPLLRNSAEILLQRVPRGHEEHLSKALDNVHKVKGVCGVKGFHVWSFTNVNIVGTLHLHVSSDADKQSAKAQVLEIFRQNGVDDLTLQVVCNET